jgi:rubrerythrin
VEQTLHPGTLPKTEAADERGGIPVDTDTTRPDMGEAPPAAAEILEGLNDLLQLDHDAVGAYEIAMEKLEDRDHASQIAGFLRDHERHIRELNELIAELGGVPTNEPHATAPFKQALQSLGGLGGDRGVLTAFRANELQVRTRYDSYASRANAWPTAVKRVIDRNALDEERHYRWVSEALAALGVGSGEGVETDAANALREQVTVAGHKLDAVRDRASEVAGEVRERASDAAGRAQEVAGEVRVKASEAAGAVRNRIAELVDRGATGPAHPADSTELPPGERAAALARGAGATVEERFFERPIQTLLIAGIAGFVIGRLLR